MSEQVLVSRDALRRLLEQIEIPANGSARVYFVATNEFRSAYLTLFDALHIPAPVPVPPLDDAPAQAEAAVGEDTYGAVAAVAYEANHIPGAPYQVSDREMKARFPLINSSRRYAGALKDAERFPGIKEAYHRDLAEFRAALTAKETP